MSSVPAVLLHALRTGAAAGAVLAEVFFVGFASLRFSRVRRRARLAVPLAFSAGALVVGWTTWVLGLLGTWTLLPWAGLLLAVSLPDAPRALRAARRVLVELLALARRAPLLACLASLPLVLVVPQVLLPLFDSDGMRYHVAYAKLFLLEGRVFHYRWDVTGSYPQAAEMLYALAYRLGGVDAPKLVHAAFFAGSLTVLALLVHDGKRRRRAALLAPFLYGISPVALIPAAAAFVDHVAVYHLAVAALLVRRRASAGSTGVALGAALATKLPAAPGALVLGAAAAALRARSGRRARAALLVLGAVVLAFLPFAVRNVLDTGDPIYPVGRGMLRLPIRGVTPESFRYATRVNADVPGGVPWGEDAANGRLDEVVGWHHLLGLGALLLLVRNARVRFLVPLVLAYLALAVLFRPPTRYLMPAWLGLAALEAIAVSEWPRARLRALAPLAALPAAFVAGKSMLLGDDPFRYLLGQEARPEFLRRVVPGYRATEIVNRLPPGGRVMALDFPPLVYLDRPWVAEGILTEPPLKIWLEEGASGDALLARLQALDVRVLVVTPGYGGGTPLSLLVVAENPSKAGPLEDLRRHLSLVARVDGVDVYRVPSRSKE